MSTSPYRYGYDRPYWAGRVRYHYALVAVVGTSDEGVPGEDADEVAWLTRAEIVNGGLPTAPALLPLIDMALA